MFDPGRLLDGVIRSQLSGSARRGRRRRRAGGLGWVVGGAALSPQGLTLLGGLAIAAIEHLRGKGEPGLGPGSTHAASRPNPPSIPDGSVSEGRPRPDLPPLPDLARPAPEMESTGPPPAPGDIPAPGGALAQLLLLSMIEAAKADGVVDSAERARIETQLHQSGASGEERAWVQARLDAPADLPALTSAVHDPVAAAQVYAAALIVADEQNAGEREFLRRLALGLGLSVQMTEELQSRLAAAVGQREDVDG